jgi:hypothetical protein
MSSERDVTRIVRSWMRDDEHESADRVLDAVLDQLDTTPQRRATWWPARRLTNVNSMAKLALSAAAVVVAAVIGVSLLGSGNIGGPSVTDPTPEQSADSGEALVRAWVDAVNRADRDALISMTAARVTLDTLPADGAEAVDYVLDDWCHMTIDAVERTGDSFRLDITFRDTPDGTCVAGAPGSSSSIVLEVEDGKVTRIP